MYGGKTLKVYALCKFTWKASVPDLYSAVKGKMQYVNKVQKKVQVVIDIEAKQSGIMEEKQRAIKPKKIEQFIPDTGIAMWQMDLEFLQQHMACIKENVL